MTDERQFDQMLEDLLSAEVSETPPIPEATPWRTAMERIVIGIGLNTITLNFLYLQYLLPTLGLLMLWLGARTLRKENRWFTAFWVICTSDLAAQFVRLVLLATPVDDGMLMGLTYASIPVNILQLLCLWQGIKAVRRAAGQPAEAGAAGALVIWQIVLCALALLHVEGWLFGLPVLVGYGFTLYYLTKVPALLDGAGYTVHAAPVRVSDDMAKWLYLGLLIAGIVIASIVCSRHPMAWTPVPEHEQAGLEDVRTHLLDLGFPEPVLNDLTAADLAALKDAEEVYAENDARTMEERMAYAGVEQEPNLTSWGIAVRLPEGRWMAIHHFQWRTPPKYRASDCLSIAPASEIGDGTYGYDWEDVTSGRVLYDRDGTTYASPYASLEFEEYTYEAWWGGTSTNQRLFAEFSLPRKGERLRGYVTYTVAEKETDPGGTLFNSWCNYIHQIAGQYPHQSAMNRAKNGGWNQGAFRLVQDALQFFPGEGLLQQKIEPPDEIDPTW